MTHTYLSTYCFHGHHGDCRLTCKICQTACICACHKDSGKAAPLAASPDDKCVCGYPRSHHGTVLGKAHPFMEA